MIKLGCRLGTAILVLSVTLLTAAVAGAQQPQAPPSAIAGTVLDDETGEPVIDAGVELVGTDKRARTDIDGQFRIVVPPGKYQVRVFAPGYTGARLTDVEVSEGKPATVEVALKSGQDAGVDVVEVVAKAKQSTEAAQILVRQKADVVVDTIGAETFEKAPDSNAAEVVQRVSAVTIKDDFVFVRGLGERYSSALLDGSRLPSPNPDKRVIPLDFFPADFIDSLSIIKSYTPNLPGDFAGGLIDINLLEFPDTLTWKLGTSLGFNTNTTFQDFNTYDTAREFPNFFGASTVRDLPGIFGNDRIMIRSREDMTRFASSLKDVWSPEGITAPPNSSIDFEVGNRWGPFGVALALLWENKYETVLDQIERQFINAGTPENPNAVLAEDFEYDYSTFFTEVGGVLTSEYDLEEAGRLALRALYQRMTADEVQLGSGFRRQNPEIDLDVTRLTYQVEDLAFGQLAGEHEVEDIGVNWRSAFGRTTLDRPDTRTTVYESSAANPIPRFSRTAGSGTRLFLDIVEYMSDTQVDFTFPFTTGLPFTDVWDGLQASFKMGGAFTWRDRDSQLRKFLFRPTRTDDTDFLEQPPEDILNGENVADGLVDFIEDTTDQDSFKAREKIIAGYGMFELPLVKDRFRFVGGVRGENSVIDITFFRQDQQGAPNRRSLVNLDPMPSANFIYSPRSDMNVRLGYSQTVSRPEFRELSPIQFPEPFGLRPVVGNPDLIESTIDNVDLRWEWFFSPLEIASMSFFYKQIQDPIETVVLTLSGTAATSFANFDSADLWGFEWEARKHFGFLDPALQSLALFLNASWIESESSRDAPAQTGDVTTSASGPLVGQAPFVINAALEYAPPDWGVFRLIYNTIGERLDARGANGLPDIFEQRRDQLDFTFSKTFDTGGVPLNTKFSIENILNDDYLWTQADIVQSRFRTGVTFNLALSYRY
jgi:hypothetical protein